MLYVLLLAFVLASVPITITCACKQTRPYLAASWNCGHEIFEAADMGRNKTQVTHKYSRMKLFLASGGSHRVDPPAPS